MLKFAYLPAPGIVLDDDGQRYSLTASEPYQRADGQASGVLTWASNCPDCGSRFTTTTGMTPRFDARRCPPCRKPRVKVAR